MVTNEVVATFNKTKKVFYDYKSNQIKKIKQINDRKEFHVIMVIQLCKNPGQLAGQVFSRLTVNHSILADAVLTF